MAFTSYRTLAEPRTPLFPLLLAADEVCTVFAGSPSQRETTRLLVHAATTQTPRRWRKAPFGSALDTNSIRWYGGPDVTRYIIVPKLQRLEFAKPQAVLSETEQAQASRLVNINTSLSCVSIHQEHGQMDSASHGSATVVESAGCIGASSRSLLRHHIKTTNLCCE